jgi:hypothetical protein
MAIKKGTIIMVKSFCVLSILFSFSVASAEYASFKEFDRIKYHKIVQQNTIELGRTRSQDGLGVCYAFTSAKQFEHLCSSNSTCDLDGEEISPLAIARTTEQGTLKEVYSGGLISWFLENAKHKQDESLSLVKESCIPYDQTIHKRYISERTYIFDEAQGVKYLREVFDKVKSPDCIDCEAVYASEIKTTLVRLKTPISAIQNLLSKLPELSFESFLDKLLFKNACNDNKNKINVPPFKLDLITISQVKRAGGFASKIKELIDNNTPPTLGLCLDVRGTDGSVSCGGHAVMIDGYRKRCSIQSECKMEYRVKNSWGESWQKSNNNGWVDGETLELYTLNSPLKDNKFKSRSVNLSVMEVVSSTNSSQVAKNPLDIDRPIRGQSVIIKRPTAPIISNDDDTVTLVPDSDKDESNDDNTSTSHINWACVKTGEIVKTSFESEKLQFESDGYRCHSY